MAIAHYISLPYLIINNMQHTNIKSIQSVTKPFFLFVKTRTLCFIIICLPCFTWHCWRRTTVRLLKNCNQGPSIVIFPLSLVISKESRCWIALFIPCRFHLKGIIRFSPGADYVMSCILVIQVLIATENSMKTAAHTGTTSFSKSGTRQEKKCTKIMDFYKIMIPISSVSFYTVTHTHK